MAPIVVYWIVENELLKFHPALISVKTTPNTLYTMYFLSLSLSVFAPFFKKKPIITQNYFKHFQKLIRARRYNKIVKCMF